MTEIEIRRRLLARLASSPEGEGAAFIPEMFVGGFSRRADLVVANGKLAAFEIKSTLDSLERLQGQLESYTRHFELVTVVCADKHVAGVRAQVAPHVGIWRVSTNGEFHILRKARARSVTEKSAWLSFLPVDELKVLLRREGSKVGGSRPELLQRAHEISLNKTRGHVLSYLKRRHLRIEAKLMKRSLVRQPTEEPKWLNEERLRMLSAGQPVAAIPRKTRGAYSKSSLSSPPPSGASANLVEKSSCLAK